MEYLKKLNELKGFKWFCERGIWIPVIGIMIYNLYRLIRDPQGTWDAFIVNIQNPWSWIPLGIILLIPIVVGIALLWDKFIVEPKRRALLDSWRESLEKSFEETLLMKKNDLPDDESIAKYYKMYLKKFELDNTDVWNVEDPMTFEEFEMNAKRDIDEIGFRVRWQFMIAMTSDAFMYTPGSGTSTMMRYRDYEELIKE